MKKYLLILITAVLFLLNLNIASAQKVDRFCTISFDSDRPKHPNITVDLGMESNYKDTSIIQSLVKVKSFNTGVEILNYMSKLGWILISDLMLPHQYDREKYLFKKSFDESEVLNK